METTVLQVPMSKSLRTNASAVAREHGFSSLQEIIRVLLTKLAKRELRISVSGTESVTLTATAKKRYKQMTQDFRLGRNIYHAKNVDDFFKYLNS